MARYEMGGRGRQGFKSPLELVSFGKQAQGEGVSSKVKVINPVWNGNGLVKRKVAEYYVAEGRAEWVGQAHSWRLQAGAPPVFVPLGSPGM